MHPMRRADRAASPEAILEILHEADYAVLSLNGTDGLPYGVPLSYAIEQTQEGLCMYFHAAVDGYKLECLNAQPNAHCVVVSRVSTIPEKFSTAYRSVMLEGLVEPLTEEEEKLHGLLLLTTKYSPGLDQKAHDYALRALKKVAVLRMRVRAVSGKQRLL